MKVAILSESSADEAAVRILVDALLGQETESLAAHPRLRKRGWPSVREILPAVIRHLHYHTDAEALVVVVDSNHSPVYRVQQEEERQASGQCRLAELHKVLAEAQERLRPVASRANVKTAIGLAVPAIEAWYVCGLHPNVSEAAWIRALASGAFDYTRNDLKREAYGTDRPSLPMETRKAEEQARRLAAQLDLLERQFPIGFGALAADVRGW